MDQREIRVTARMLPGRIVSMTAPFIPGLKLAGAFYDEAVRPLLDEAFQRLPYAAALPPGLVPARCLAVRTGLSVAAHGPGRGLPQPLCRGRRRAGIGHRHRQARPAVGAVDEFIDSTDALGSTGFLRAAIAAASSAAADPVGA